MLLVSLSVVGIWIYLGLGRGGFWRMREEAVPHPRRGGKAKVTAVVPARNEAGVIGRAVASLAAQRYEAGLPIVVVDDASSDGTAAEARAAGPATTVRLVEAAPLPAGWSGKVWAMAEGVREASGDEPDFYLLTDADIVHPPDNVEALVQRAASREYDVVSYMATLRCASPAERWLIPAFVFFFFQLYPPAWIRDRRRATAGAAGGCILIRRTALERIGGMQAIAGELIDDCALARAVKRSGGTVWLGLSRGTRSIREYDTPASIGRMISRTAFTQLRHSPLILGGTLLGLMLTYVAPPWIALTSRGWTRAGGAFSWALMTALYTPAVRYYRQPWWCAPLLPLAAVFYTGATVHSAVVYWRGQGGQWKGRVQDQAASAQDI